MEPGVEEVKSPPVAALWPRCAVTGNSKTGGGVVEGLRVKRGIFFFTFNIDDRRACSYADR